jgi:hypothetical protein
MTRLQLGGIIALILITIIGGANLAGRHFGIKDAEAKAEIVLNTVKADLNTCRLTVATQAVSIETQNAVVDKLGADTQAAKSRHQIEMAQARNQAEVYRKRALNIARINPPPPGADQCLASQSLIIDTLSEDRK